jgi:predicted DNA-binding transcriptional regulator AlpA
MSAGGVGIAGEPERLWTADDLAAYMRLSRSTIFTLRSRNPGRLPPPVNDEGRPRWHPQTVRDWFAKKGKTKAGRPRSSF